MNFIYEPKRLDQDFMDRDFMDQDKVLNGSPRIADLHLQIAALLERTENISMIMMHNTYEQIVPFNIWFVDPKYRIVDFYENRQHIRARYYGDILLTPLVTMDYIDMGQVGEFIDILTTYQPFYPETFYQTWEFLQYGLKISTMNYLHIGREHTLGTMEAVILHNERYNTQYLQTKYHCWIVGNEMRNSDDDSYRMVTPQVDYLGQTFPLTYLTSTTEMKTYDFITIDCGYIFENILEWKHQEYDLHHTLFYILYAIKFLKKGGCMAIKMHMICTTGWLTIIHFLEKVFIEHTWIRPIISNPLNPEIILYVTRYTPSKKLFNSISYNLHKNMYLYKLYDGLYLNYMVDNNSHMITTLFKQINKWKKGVTEVINKGIPNESRDSRKKNILELYKKINLSHIGSLSSLLNTDTCKYLLKYSKSNKTPILNINQASITSDSYPSLLEAKSILNSFKRVMDSKPSQIFANTKYTHSSRNYLMTWEDLTSHLDCSRDIKHILKQNYCAEMVTNAWLKMYEILHLIPNILNSQSLNSFHICEAPGAFISSLNHFVAYNKFRKWKWIAQTLKPTDPTALEDHYGLIQKYPNNWLWGSERDNSGDITHTEVIKWYQSKCKDINLITADGGIRLDPLMINEQELQMSKIILGEVITILACLQINGNAIIKMFLPMSEPLTISLVYLLTIYFNEVFVTKPQSSHSDNSEIYLILIGYKGIPKHTLETLYQLLNDIVNDEITTKTLLFQEIPHVFMKSYTKIINSYINRQIQSLSRSYYYYYHLDQMRPDMLNITQPWFDKHPIDILDTDSVLLQ